MYVKSEKEMINSVVHHSKVDHHSKVLESCNLKLNWWNDQILNDIRCAKCWLRKYECYCQEIKTMGEKLSIYNSSSSNYHPLKIKVCLYYHYQEIGRSANTAHLFDALCSYADHCNSIFIECEVIILGDSEKEDKLIKEIYNETIENKPKTCILYPVPNCKSIHDWIFSSQVSSYNSKMPSMSDSVIMESNSTFDFRIVLLDGTYPQANRMYRFLASSLKKQYGVELPLVKLDLGATGQCRSALFGIQSQPGYDKLCSYQAVVMAIKQLEAAFVKLQLKSSSKNNVKYQENFTEKYDYMSSCLDSWLKYVLTKKIKYGKRSQNFKLPDMEPAEYVKEIIRKNLSHPLPGITTSTSCMKNKVHNYKVNELQTFLRYNKPHISIYMIKTEKFFVYNADIKY